MFLNETRKTKKKTNKQERITEESLGMPYYSSNLVQSNAGIFFLWLARFLQSWFLSDKGTPLESLFLGHISKNAYFHVLKSQ